MHCPTLSLLFNFQQSNECGYWCAELVQAVSYLGILLQLVVGGSSKKWNVDVDIYCAAQSYPGSSQSTLVLPVCWLSWALRAEKESHKASLQSTVLGLSWVLAPQAVCGTAGRAHLWVLHVVGSANYSELIKEKDPVKSKGTTKYNSPLPLPFTNLPCRANLCSGASSRLSSV